MSLRNRRPQGFTLIELMIALTLGLLITGAMVFLFTSSKQSFNTQEGMSQVQEAGRTALRNITRTIRYAGYLPNPLQDTDPTAKFLPPNDLPIVGTDGVPAVSLGISNARTDTDSISITYYGNSDQGIQTCLGDNANDDAGNPTLVNVVYYVSSAAATLNSLMCWTRRIRDITAIQSSSSCTTALCATTVGQPLVDGVSSFQILYGVDSDGDGVANQYLTASNISTNAQWRSVVAVQITLVLQSTNTGTNNPVSRTYSTTIAIRNRLSP
jgi:type IV pilus assembly protein PilW